MSATERGRNRNALDPDDDATQSYMANDSAFVEYTRLALAEFAGFDRSHRYMMVDAVGAEKAERVLDVGCGAGQQLLPFVERKDSFCVGIDISEEVGNVGPKLFAELGFGGRSSFFPALGEDLPFADASFDVVICRVALPYMDNRKTIAEIARVLRSGGKFFLKTHAPAFYLWMLKNRLSSLSIRQYAYPMICLACGTLNLLTGRHPKGSFWKGKEVYQTKAFLQSELAKNNLRIVGELIDSNIATPSFVIEKG